MICSLHTKWNVVCAVYLPLLQMWMYDPLSGKNRWFLYSNNRMPQLILGSCERTSLKVVVWSLWSGCKIGCLCVWFGLRLLIWSWHYGVKLVFLFFSSFALQVAPTIWHQALKTRPRLSHQNGMKIYPHIPRRPVALSQVSRALQAEITGLVGWMEKKKGIWRISGDTRCGL